MLIGQLCGRFPYLQKAWERVREATPRFITKSGGSGGGGGGGGGSDGSSGGGGGSPGDGADSDLHCQVHWAKK